VLVHLRAGWFTVAILFSVFVLFQGHIIKKLSLLVVTIFPWLNFLGSIAFLNWVYTGNTLAFFRSSHSFFPYLPNFSWIHWKYTLFQFPRWAVFLGPLLVGTSGEKKRLFWAIAFIIGSMALPFSLPLLATLLTLGAIFLRTPPSGKIHRSIFSLSLGIALVTGWISFFQSPLHSFIFSPYQSLQEKLTEYREIASLLNTPTVVLVLDRDPFLTTSWSESLTAVISQLSPPQTVPAQPYEYIVQSAESSNVIPGFKEIFQGKKLQLYQKEKTPFPLP
ncbi:MAG: hypothetical protein ABDK92_09955, partial [Atribacterota bacterium]